MKKLAILLAVITLCTCFGSIAIAATPTVEAVGSGAIEIGKTTKKLPAVEGTENLVINGGFEELDEKGVPKNWTSRCYNMENGTGAFVATGAEARTGKNAIKLIGGAAYPSNYPFVMQDFSTLGKATYQMSAWVRKDAGTSDMTVKLEFWPEMLPGASTVQESNTFSIHTTSGYEEVLFNFVAPFTAKSVSLLARLQDEQEEVAYFDDISVYMVKPPEAIDIVPDQNFYYEDMKEGFATASILTDFFPEAIGGSVDFSLLDGEKELKAETAKVDDEHKAYFNYPTSLLTELKKEYRVKGVLKDADGNVIMETSEPIYRFNRPKWMNKDGVFQAPGEEPFMPVYVYHAFGDYYDKCHEAGINLMQGDATMADNKHNIKQIVVLYQKGQPAAADINLQRTIDLVTKYKDDPRIYGWAVMDEPHLRMPDPHDALREAYRVIRTIDDNHPVYVCEASSNHYEDTMKNVDVLCIDPYLPGVNYANGKMHTTHVYEKTQLARQSGHMQKPVLNLLQAFQWYGYLPDADAERHMIYQSFMGGAQGIGFYSMSDPITIDGKKVPLYEIPNSDLWDGIVAWSANEKEDAFRHFVFREYGGFSHYVGEDVMYHGYIKDNRLYMIVMNQSITETVKAEIPLVSFDGSIEIDNYFGEYLYGGEGKNIKGKTNTLPVTLKPNAAVVLKVSPRRATDFGSLDQEAFWAYFDATVSGEAEKEPHFTDLTGYDWAKEDIESLYREGIVNEKGEGLYAPGNCITRGDFAMFLVKTLGLTAETEAENFSDVDPEAEYAEAVRIGKAAGVLNGVGENLYMPEAEITRQDLMTICFRGIKAIQETEEAPMLTDEDFPDWKLTAEYARAAISAMVREEVVRGNANGTLNPLGNTTRAEAAVIMKRMANLTK